MTSRSITDEDEATIISRQLLFGLALRTLALAGGAFALVRGSVAFALCGLLGATLGHVVLRTSLQAGRISRVAEVRASVKDERDSFGVLRRLARVRASQASALSRLSWPTINPRTMVGVLAVVPALLLAITLIGTRPSQDMASATEPALPLPPPPPPPAPKIVEERPASKPKAQQRPAAFVPKAEVQLSDSNPQAGITAVSAEADTAKVEAEKPTAAAPVVEAPKREPVLEQAKLMPGCKAPRYPAMSLEKEEEGLVVFRFLVGLDGSVKQAVMVQSSGFERLDKAAKEAFERCKFTPGKIDGESRETWVRQPFRWKIQ